MKVTIPTKMRINQKVYPAGVHELSPEQAEHWYTKALLKSGKIELWAPAVVKPKKTHTVSAPKVEAPVAPPVVVAPVPSETVQPSTKPEKPLSEAQLKHQAKVAAKKAAKAAGKGK